MINIILTQEQATVLAGAIENYLSDLRMEITDTDSGDYKGMLKQEKQVLIDILDSIRHENESVV